MKVASLSLNLVFHLFGILPFLSQGMEVALEELQDKLWELDKVGWG